MGGRSDSQLIGVDLKKILDAVKNLDPSTDSSEDGVVTKVLKWTAGGGVTGLVGYGEWQLLGVLAPLV